MFHLNSDLEPKIRKMADEVIFIEQGYLLREKGLTVRLRKQGREVGVSHILTVKSRVNKDRVIEIEKDISEADFMEMSKEASGWLRKVRYVVGDWEVDFFKSDGNTYFIMAEIEMPDGMKKPDLLPKFVVDNLLYGVPREDARFSSKKLSDLDYAKKLLQETQVFANKNGNKA